MYYVPSVVFVCFLRPVYYVPSVVFVCFLRPVYYVSSVVFVLSVSYVYYVPNVASICRLTIPDCHFSFIQRLLPYVYFMNRACFIELLKFHFIETNMLKHLRRRKRGKVNDIK